MDLLNEITENDIADLNEECQQLIELVGLDVFKKLVREHNGRSIYIPRRKNIESSLRNKKIIRDFDGGNYKELAGKYDLTETWIREIVKKAGLI